MTRFGVVLAAVLGSAGMLISASAALAAPAAATTTLNVRSGPGTNFGIVGQLAPGQVVEVTECVSNGWCHITQSGPNGWVSSTYLTAPPSPPGPGPGPQPPAPPSGGSNSDCSFGFNVGPGGPNFSINCGNQPPSPPPPGPPSPPPPPPPPPPPVGDEACFYTGANYQGSEFCYGVGTRNTLSATFNDNISSVRLYGAAKARLCVNQNLGGACYDITANTPVLGPQINDRASSLRVYTGVLPTPLPLPVPPPVFVPVTHSTGPIALQQTFAANLDTGSVGSAGADIWYQAETAVARFLNPRNGAALSLTNGAQRGFAGCSAASFSGNRIPLWQLNPGTYVCYRTDQGRIGEFRVNSFSGSTMNIGYTTWAN